MIPLILFLGTMIASGVMVIRKATLSERHTRWVLWLHMIFLLLAAIDIFLLSRGRSFIGFTTDPAIFLLLFATGSLLYPAYRRQMVPFIRKLYSGIFYYVTFAFLAISIIIPLLGLWGALAMLVTIPVIPIDGTHSIRLEPGGLMGKGKPLTVIHAIGPLLEHTLWTDETIGFDDTLQVLEFREGEMLRIRTFDRQSGKYASEITIDLKDSE
ncbi:MAG: hypothetical protein ABI876_06580 [Bacteroidota bacterium]